jgi:hypothetical protein
MGLAQLETTTELAHDADNPFLHGLDVRFAKANLVRDETRAVVKVDEIAGHRAYAC